MILSKPVDRVAVNIQPVPQYGQKRLIGYASTFRELANTYASKKDVPVNKSESLLAAAVNEPHMIDETDKQSILDINRLKENNAILADHFLELANIIENVAKEAYDFTALDTKRRRLVETTMKSCGVDIESIYIMEKNCPMRMAFLARDLKASKTGGEGISIHELAGAFSVIFSKQFIPSYGTASYIRNEFVSVMLEEAPKYVYMSGIAVATKEGEEISGDNYAVFESDKRRVCAVLSDGCGCGSKASADSDYVLDLLDKLLDAGFNVKSAVKLINGNLMFAGDEENLSTLDICEIDLFEGYAQFYKMGGTVSFIKHCDNSIEVVKSGSFPLGIFAEQDFIASRHDLRPGDYIIMVTDGVTESIENGIQILKEVIAKLPMENPREVAAFLLRLIIQATFGRVRDDMSILVLGIWENGGEY